MVRYHFAAALAFVVTVLATPLPQQASGSSINENAAGAQNVGKGNGQQFITGQCLSDADCASGCCATLNGGGVCSARAVATANGKQGCGFGGTGNNAAPAANSGSSSSSSGTTGSGSTSGSTVNENASGAQNVGKGDGSQFITGQCFSDADCASGCCATKNGAGVCSARLAAFDQGKQGCGFTAAGVSSTTGNSATESSTTESSASESSASGGASSSSASSAGSAVNENAPGAQNVGKGNGSQFITGQCLSDADCASGCCATKNGAGVCSARLAAFDQGKQGCGFAATGV